MSLPRNSKAVSEPREGVTFRLPSEASVKNGLGRKPSIADTGKVRLGGLGPIFRTLSIEDKGNVRLGGLGPVFRV